MDATVGLRGRSLAVGFTGHDLAYGSHRAVVLSVDARIDREGREHSWLRLRSNGITLAGFAISDTRLSLDGLAQDHALTFRVGAGQDAVALKGRGGWADDRYTLALENIAASGPRIVPWKLASASRFTASRRDATLDPVCLAYESRRFCFEGRWTAGGAWSVAANTDAFPLEALDPKRRGAPGYRGLLTIDAKASGRAGEPWIADLEAEIRDASLTYQSASGADRTVALGRTRLALDSDAGRHRLNLRVSDAADDRPRRGARGDARGGRRVRGPAAQRQRQGPHTATQPAADARRRDRQRFGRGRSRLHGRRPRGGAAARG